MRIILTLFALLVIALPSFAAEPAEQLIPEPEWLRKPGGEEVADVFPQEAARRGIGGSATIKCRVTSLGSLAACEVVEESPPGMGFGGAVLRLARRFQMKPYMVDGRPVGGRIVRVPVKFELEGGAPSGTAVRNILNPVWSAAPTFAQMDAAWPGGAAQLPEALVVLHCRTTDGGELDDCERVFESHSMEGFGHAALRLSHYFRLDLRAYDQTLLGEAYVDVPIHFLNPASQPPTMVENPVWVVGLDPKKLHAVFPEAAAAAGITKGRGVAECAVAPTGRLVDCTPVLSPGDQHGFGAAAALVGSAMQMNPWTEGGRPVDGARIRLPIVFQLAGDETPKS